MVKFLDGDRPMWQRGLALEVLHKLATQPSLLQSFCTNYDMKPHATKIFQVKLFVHHGIDFVFLSVVFFKINYEFYVKLNIWDSIPGNC